MPSEKNNHNHNSSNISKKKKKKAVLKHKHRPQNRKKYSPLPQTSRKPGNWVATNDSPLNKSDTPAINASTTPIIEEINNDIPTEESIEDEDFDESLSAMVSSESFASQAAYSPLEDGGIKSISNGNTNASRVAQITAPIISIFGGIALVAVAIFYVTRKRKRNSVHTLPLAKNKPEDQDPEKMHDIPLNDNDDEAIIFSDSSHEEHKTVTSLAFPSSPFQYHQQDSNYQHHFESPNINDYYERTNRDSIYYNSLDYQSSMMSDTLIESHITTRSNSISTKKTRSFVSKPINTTSSRSSCSSIYTDALVSPTSTLIGAHYSSFLMIAERQQLQHERPNILDYFNESSRSTPIQTYKAQLSDIVDLGEEIPDIEPSILPFHSVIDFSHIY